MKLISTRAHGILDYLVGALMIGAPWWLGFHRGGAETAVFVVLGAGALLYSLLTRYELGALKLIPMGTHLILDLVSGLFLAISPWIFGFASFVWIPHVAFGIFEITAAVMTRKQPAAIHAAAAH